MSAEVPATLAAPAASGLRSHLRAWARDLVIALGLGGFHHLFPHPPVKGEGHSMAPRLEGQEPHFINKFVYTWEPIQRGDIVVFRYPRDPSKSYIKRVIGVAGDRVRIERGRVYVNGQALGEDYVPAGYADAGTYPETLVPAGSCFVLGDHRNMSNDSREFGSVEQKYIYGKAVFIYWPVEKIGALR